MAVQRQIPLPIDGVLPELNAVLERRSSVVLTAPPGSGKTTRVPPAVARAVSGRVILLQPRRVAARACAHRIAWEQGTRVGDQVGYWVRFDRKVSDATKIEVLTEGLLTRLLQSDPFLAGVDAVILDEFHERSLHSDLALALLAEVQRDVRPDLKLIVMSATLDAAPVQQFLGGEEACPLLTAEGRVFPVECVHHGLDSDRHMEPQIAAIVREAVQVDPDGHVLVFLPGVGEIERVRQRLSGSGLNVLPLHGRLSAADQDRAIGPSDRPKVVLATNIAETSLTIDGITTVVDSGLARRPRFDPRIGVERLETVPISLASADQRAGRAGRTRAGRCIRLWSRAEHGLRVAHDPPSMEQSDLCSTVLDLYAWGTRPSGFGWFEPPPAAAVSQAEGLLTDLGAIEGGQITATGTDLARMPVHPRLAQVVVRGHQLGVLHEAAGAAALASERDPWSRETNADLLTRLEWLDSSQRTGADPRALAAVRRVRDDLVRLGRRMRSSGSASSSVRRTEGVLDALIAGFPDRVGRRREKGSRSVLLASGNGVDLGPGVEVGEWMVAVTLTAGTRGRAPLIRVAATLDSARLECPWKDELVFERSKEAVVQRRVRRFGAIVLSEEPARQQASPDAVAKALFDAAYPRFERLFPMDGDAGVLLARVRFCAQVRPDEPWPTWVNNPESLLSEWCHGRRSFAELRKLNVAEDLLSRLPWELRKTLDKVAPERLRVPSGAMVRLEYVDDKPPVLAARIQQMFGMMTTPKLGGMPITVHLLAPNGRPAQVTQDLASFWANTYAEVRKDLRGRYPKHTWPEDPSEAIPENRPKRRKKR
jgi:ATP-dependent helicase HrpB